MVQGDKQHQKRGVERRRHTCSPAATHTCRCLCARRLQCGVNGCYELHNKSEHYLSAEARARLEGDLNILEMHFMDLKWAVIKPANPITKPAANEAVSPAVCSQNEFQLWAGPSPSRGLPLHATATLPHPICTQTQPSKAHDET